MEEKQKKTNKKENKEASKEVKDKVENVKENEENIEVKNEKIKDKTEEKSLINKEESSLKINEKELDTIKKEIKKNKKTKKLKEKKQLKYKEILKNILICMLMIFYLIALIVGKCTMNTIKYITALKILIMVEVFISLIIFEIAYSKDKFDIGIHGIETLTLSGLTILILDLFNKQNESIWLVFSIITGVILFYYLIKIIIIALKKKK